MRPHEKLSLKLVGVTFEGRQARPGGPCPPRPHRSPDPAPRFGWDRPPPRLFTTEAKPNRSAPDGSSFRLQRLTLASIAAAQRMPPAAGAEALLITER